MSAKTTPSDPLIAVNVLPWTLGVFALIAGLAFIVAAFRIRKG